VGRRRGRLSKEEGYESGLLFPQWGGEEASRGDQEMVTHGINANPLHHNAKELKVLPQL
jgi:hypothetical protein